MPAIGRLSWITVESTQRVLSCVLGPGTSRKPKVSMKIPLGGRTIVMPSGAILQAAGGSQAYLEDAATAVSDLVVLLEDYVEHIATERGRETNSPTATFTWLARVLGPTRLPPPGLGHPRPTCAVAEATSPVSSV